MTQDDYIAIGLFQWLQGLSTESGSLSVTFIRTRSRQTLIFFVRNVNNKYILYSLTSNRFQKNCLLQQIPVYE